MKNEKENNNLNVEMIKIYIMFIWGVNNLSRKQHWYWKNENINLLISYIDEEQCLLQAHVHIYDVILQKNKLLNVAKISNKI